MKSGSGVGGGGGVGERGGGGVAALGGGRLISFTIGFARPGGGRFTGDGVGSSGSSGSSGS